MENNDLNEEVDDNTAVKEALQCEIGAKLQHMRESKNLDPDYIVKELKFSKTFLDALETGQWHKMPGEVYALGFLKQYASLLDLDVSREIERIKNKNFELTTPLTYPDAPISPNRKWVALAIVLFVVIMVVVNLPESEHTSMEEAEQVEQHQTDNMQSLTQPVNVEDSYAEQQLTEAIIPEPEAAPAAPIKRTYSFYAATNDVWLQVYEMVSDTESKLLREVLLKKGQSFSIIDTTAKLMLTAGNARSLEILEGNQVLFAAGTLGEEGKVLKRFLINP